jgi:hypothetical protein
MAVDNYYYEGLPTSELIDVSYREVTAVRDQYGSKYFIGKRSYDDMSLSLGIHGSWSSYKANETIIGIEVNGDMKQTGTQVFAVSEAEVIAALGLQEGEKITNITWEKGTSHFPGGIVIYTETPKADAELGQVASKK